MFGSRAVAELARVSVRMLQWWREQGILKPAQAAHGGQHVLIYDSRQTLRAMVIAELRERGIALRVLVRAIATLPEDLEEPEFLVFDGKTFFDCADAESALGISATVAPVWLGNYERGRWGWITRNLKAIDPPIPARGSRGLWDWHEAVRSL